MSIFDYQLAEIEVSYSHRVPARERFKITNSKDAYSVACLFWPEFNIVEYFYAIYLNQNSQVLGFHQVSKGGITSCPVDVQMIVAIGLKSLSRSIICVHNHPSGNLEPSHSDLQVTRKIKEACTMVDLKLLDHLVVTAESFHSLADNGQI